MLMPDVNVLICAFRADTPQYEICRQWLNKTIKRSVPLGMSPLALSAVVRITTRISQPNPSTLDEAFGYCQDIVDQPNCAVVTPGAQHCDIFRNLCLETHTTGPRVTDAWFAALAIEWGCEWVTMDRDFARFPGLRWRTPES